MNELCWTMVHARNVPLGSDWLGDRERAQESQLRAGKRLRDWRLGRWAAKRLLEARGYRGAEVIKDPNGAPVALRGQESLPVVLSISHRADRAIAALSPALHIGLGCDIELVEPRREVFVRDFFTADEQAAVDGWPRAERDLRVTLIWSAKESALKLLRVGLGRDTRTVDVHVTDHGSEDWMQLAVRDLVGGAVFSGYWRALAPVAKPRTEPAGSRAPLATGPLVATMVAGAPCLAPREVYLRSFRETS